MTIPRTRTLLATTLLLAGCAAAPPATVKHHVPRDSTVAVVMFQDCDIANQLDCDGSGAKAGAIFTRVFSQRPGMRAVSLPRPVGAKVPLSDDAAVAYAKAKGYRYVINGEVQDYYGGHVSLHANRAAVFVRVLSTSKGLEMASYRQQEKSVAHVTAPDDMLEDMAKQLAAGVMIEPNSRRDSKFLFYKGNGAG